MSRQQKDRLEEAKAGAVDSDAVWSKNAQPPIIGKWDSQFEEWLAMRTAEAKAYRAAGICSFPWEIIKAVPARLKNTDRLFWNQGPVPSCSLHGATHGTQFTTLIEMLHGAPVRYNAFNPIVPFYIARGGNLAGGLGLVETAETVNMVGQFPTTLVGDDNQRVPENWKEHAETAKRYQAAICYISDHLVEKIIACCKAPVKRSGPDLCRRSGTDQGPRGGPPAAMPSASGWRKHNGKIHFRFQFSRERIRNVRRGRRPPRGFVGDAENILRDTRYSILREPVGRGDLTEGAVQAVQERSMHNSNATERAEQCSSIERKREICGSGAASVLWRDDRRLWLCLPCSG